MSCSLKCSRMVECVTLQTLSLNHVQSENGTMQAIAMKPTAKDAYRLFKSGMSFRDIAGQLGIGMAQVIVAIRKRESAIAAMRNGRMEPTEKPTDTKLKSHQIMSILEESQAGQTPANIAITLDVTLHDIKRILRDLDGNEGNLQRVIYAEMLGKELLEAIESDLIENADEKILRNVYGKLNFHAIAQAICHSTGPTQKEWAEHCQRYKLEWDEREERSDKITDWPFPRRCWSLLTDAGIESITRLHNIIDGTDAEYSTLEQIPGVDYDARDRVLAVLNDETASVLPTTIQYHGPYIQADECDPPAKCIVKLTQEPLDASPDIEQ